MQPYLISWFHYAPADEIARVDARILIAQGTTDIQVAVSEAEALKAARPDAELLVLDGMNHVMKRVPPDRSERLASYGDPTLPVDPALVDGLARFIE